MIPFRQARHFRPGRRDPKTGEPCPVRCVVLHTAEIGESLQGAEALMNVCATSERQASWHEWADVFSTGMLERSAELVAGICHRHGIPCVRIEADEVRDGHAGVCGHVDVSKAFGKSDHWDPGPNFPWRWYMLRVMHYAREYRSQQDTLDDSIHPITEPSGPPAVSDTV